MNNIVTAAFGGSRSARTRGLYQWDYGMVLQFTGLSLPSAYTVHFSNTPMSGTAKTQVGNADGVSIPDEYLTTGGNVYAWIFLHSGENDGYTCYMVTIPVTARPQPTEDAPTPVQRSVIDQAIAALNGGIQAMRVSSLDNTPLAAGRVIEAADTPTYVSDATLGSYSAYGLTDTGWYVFARIAAPYGETVTASTSVTGAAGSIVTVGADHVDVAVRFDTTAQSQEVIVAWGSQTDSFVFKATDLAVRNLDYRTTFYIYDITPYITWSYALTTDATFVADKNYYTLSDGVYTLADVTTGETVPADTYYNHSKLAFAGMVANVTYKLDEIVDCPIEITLPDVADDGHGAWFEIQMRYSGSFSCTLLPPEGVKIGTAQTQAQAAGMNTIDLQYTDAGDVKMWTLLNTHSNIPTT